MIHSQEVTVTTIADGSATAYTAKKINGHLLSIIYIKTDYDNGVDFTITSEDTAQNLWVDTNINATEQVNPRHQVQLPGGIAAWYNDESDEPALGKIALVSERVKIVIAQGGDTKSGVFTIIWEGTHGID